MLIVSLILHVGVVLIMGDPARPALYEHQIIAENILEGNGFSINLFGRDRNHPTSQQAPGLVSLYVLARMLFPSATANVLMMVTEAILMAFVPIFIFLGLKFLGVSGLTSSIAGWLVVLHPNYLYAPTHIQVVNFSVFFVALGLMVGSYILGRAFQSSGFPYAIFGTICGIGMLFEPILILLPLIFWVGVLVIKREYLRFILKNFIVWFLPVWILILAPWTLRNFQVHGRLMPIKSTFWYSFWQANNPNSFGTDKIPPEGGYGYFDFLSSSSILDARGEVTDVNSSLSPEFLRRIADMPETGQFDAFKALALAFLKEDPVGYLRLVLKRFGYFVWIDTTNPTSFHPLYWGTSILLWLGLLLGCKPMYRGNRSLLIWLGFYLGCFGMFHALTIYAARFRMPVEWVFLVFWAFFLAGILTLISNKKNIRVFKTDWS